MKELQPEDSLKLIRDVMDKSARYTHFSGISGIVAGLVAIIGCIVTWKVAYTPAIAYNYSIYALIWIFTFIIAISQDFYLANRKARRNGQNLWGPAAIHIIKAVLPGVFIALVLSVRFLIDRNLGDIPSIWALCYGVSLCAAGLFTVKEVTYHGVAQLVIGTLGLALKLDWPASLILAGISMGLCHIVFGIVIVSRYGR